MKLIELPSQGRGGPEFQHRSVSTPEPYEPALISEASRTWQPLYACTLSEANGEPVTGAMGASCGYLVRNETT